MKDEICNWEQQHTNPVSFKVFKPVFGLSFAVIPLLLFIFCMFYSTPAFAAAGDVTPKTIGMSCEAGDGKFANAGTYNSISFNGNWPGASYTVSSYGLVPEGTEYDISAINSAFIYLGDDPGTGAAHNGYKYLYVDLTEISPPVTPGQYRVVVYALSGGGEEVFYSDAPVQVIEGDGFVYDMSATTVEVTAGGAVGDADATELTLHLRFGNAAPVSFLPSDVIYLDLFMDSGDAVDFTNAAVTSPAGITAGSDWTPPAGMPLQMIMLKFGGSYTVLPGGLDVVISGITALTTNEITCIIKFAHEDENPENSSALGHWEGTLTFSPQPPYQPQELTTGVTGLTLSGNFTTGATVTAVTETAGNVSCPEFAEAQTGGKLIALYDISLSSGSYQGNLTITIPVGAGHDGETVSILHCKNNTLESVDATVTDGKVSGTFSSLSPFGVALNASPLPEANFSVGEDTFASLLDAVAAVPAGGTITLLKDYTTGDDCMLTANKAYTLDLGSHTYTGDGSGDGGGTINIEAGTVTIQNGTVTMAFPEGVAIWTFPGGNTILKDLTVNATAGTSSAAVYSQGGTTSILSGEYTGKGQAVRCFGGNVSIESGHFVSSGTTSCLYQSGSGRIALATGSVASPVNFLNVLSAKNVTVTKLPPNFQVGNDLYYSLSDAVNAVPQGGTITMLRDVTGSKPTTTITSLSNQNYTFDLNGYTYTGNLLVSVNKVTVKNGAVETESGFTVIQGGNATFEDLTVVATQYAVTLGGGYVSIVSGEYYGGTSAVCNPSGRVNISSGTFSTDPASAKGCIDDYNGSGRIYLAQGSQADVSNWLNGAKTATITHTDGTPSGLVIDGIGITFDADCHSANWGYTAGWAYTAATRTLTVTGDITVTGAASNQTSQLTIDIASGKTVNWQADYSATFSVAENVLYFSGTGGNLVLSHCTVQSAGPLMSLVFSEGNITINEDANMISVAENAHTVKAEGNLVMNGGYVSAGNGSNAIASRDMTVHGGFVDAGWLAADVQGTFMMDGGYLMSGQYGIQSTGNSVTLSGGVVYGRDNGIILIYASGANVTVSGGLVMIDGTDYNDAVMGANPDLQNSGIIAAFDRTQTGPFTEGTHTALVSSPANALTWAIQSEHGGVSYSGGLFLDMGVTVTPPASFVVSAGEIRDISEYTTAHGDIVFKSDDDTGTGQLTGIPGGGLQVNGKVKLVKEFTANKWYPAGFPFEIESVSIKQGENTWEGVIYNEDNDKVNHENINNATDDNYFVKYYDGTDNVFRFTDRFKVNKGYIIEFPVYPFEEGKLEATFTSVANPVIHSTSGTVGAYHESYYTLVVNPNVAHTGSLSGATHYYQYNYDNRFVQVNNLSSHLKPFEATVVYHGPATNAHRVIGDGNETTGIHRPGNDKIIRTEYYNLMGTPVGISDFSSAPSGIYLVKTVYESGKIKTVKQIIKK